MLTLSRRTDYALMALAYLAERTAQVASARDVAMAVGAPVALLMNILKDLQQVGLLESTRGSKGGYRLAVDPEQVRVSDLIQRLEGSVRWTTCLPLKALQLKLMRSLQAVKLSDLTLPGRRIDVPLEDVAEARQAGRQLQKAPAQNERILVEMPQLAGI